VSTTADPNPHEGYFISLEQAEELDVEQHYREFGQFPRGWMAKHAIPVVLCEPCRQRLAR